LYLVFSLFRPLQVLLKFIRSVHAELGPDLSSTVLQVGLQLHLSLNSSAYHSYGVECALCTCTGASVSAGVFMCSCVCLCVFVVSGEGTW
jgi:hypothetical protein